MTAPEMQLPTFQEVMQAQDDLDLLCADRPLRTSEIFSPNAYYGLDFVLKVYAGVDPDRPLKMVIPHGIEMDDSQVWNAEALTPLPMVACAPREVRKYSEQTSKTAVANATPFVYGCSLLEQSSAKARSGTLFFLSHSTHHVTARSSFDELAEQLLALPDQFQPLSVCVYWRDYMLGHHLPFAKRGIRIVSAGHMYDRRFLLRLFHLCRSHQYACSNELGSHLFYTVKAGCSFFLLGEAATYEFAHAKAETDVTAIPSQVRARLQNLFREPLPQASAEQVALVDEFTGARHRLSPDELRELIDLADTLDRFGRGRWRNSTYRARPEALRRTLWLNPKTRIRNWIGTVLRNVGARTPSTSQITE